MAIGKKSISARIEDAPESNIQVEDSTQNQNIEANSMYFKKVGDIYRLSNLSKCKILNGDKKMQWSDSFVREIQMKTVDSDFQSMRVELRYANYVFEISVLWTELDDFHLLSKSAFSSGCYGSVYEYQFNQETFAIKGINYNSFEQKNNLKKIYLEYLHCCIASNLEIGPKISSILQYDIVIFQTKACFAMQKCKEYRIYEEKIFDELIRGPLAILHSVNLIHLDIKPDNIAYSNYFKKWVFIDYGFSKIVEKPVGWKFLTGFTGTAEYCSEQMRMAYVLSRPMMVDLYMNDLVCLEKSRQKEKKKYKFFQKILQYENKEFIQKFNYYLEPTIKIIQLKYYIFYQQIDKITLLVNQLKDLKKTIYSILTNNFTDVKIRSNPHIQNIVKQLRSQLIFENFKSNYIDKYFHNFLEKSERASFTPSYLTFRYILDLPIKKFRQFMTSLDIVRKLFSIIDPLSKFFFDNIQQKITVQKKLIQKIHESQNGDDNDFMFQKVQKTLNFFYHKLLHLRDRKVFTSLKLLYCSGYNYSNLNELMFNIIQFSENPIIKFLSKIENGLLIQFIHGHYDSFNFLLDPQFKMDDCQQKDFPQLGEVKELFKLFKDRKKLPAQRCNIVKQISCLLDELQKRSTYTDIVYTIKSLFYQLQRYHSDKNQKYKESFTHRIYSRNYICSDMNTIAESAPTSQSLFRPPLLKQQVFAKKDQLKFQLKLLFQHLQSLSFIYPYFLIDCYENKFIDNEDLLQELLKNYENHLNYYQIQQEKCIFLCIDISFWMVRKIFASYLPKLRQKDQQKQSNLELFLKMENIFLGYVQKVDSSISNNSWFQIMVKSLQGIIHCYKKGSKNQVKQILEDILQIVQPFPFENFIAFSFFLYFLLAYAQYFRQQLLKDSQKYYRNVIFQIVDKYKSSEMYLIYETVPNFIYLPIMSYFIDGRQHESFNLICSFIRNVRQKGPYKLNNTYWEVLFNASDAFCIYSSMPFKKISFNKLCQENLQQCSSEALYYESKIFLSIASEIHEKEVRKELIRLTLGLAKISFSLVKHEVKNSICNTLIKFRFYKSKRQKTFLFRQSGNTKVLIKTIEKKIMKFSEKGQEYLSRSLKKLSKF